MNNAAKMYFAEFLGTAILVIIGCGSATIGGLGGALGAGPMGAVALLPIAIAFGMTVTALAYGIGPVSGCHVNPAVTVGAWVAGRMDTATAIGYIVARVIGGLAGAAFLSYVLSGVAGHGYGANEVQAGFDVGQAFVVEMVATMFFLIVILGSTTAGTATPVAGLAIGMALTVIHITTIKVTGTSVNPARSIGPALFTGGKAVADLWIFIVAPIVGAAIAGYLFKSKALEV